LTQDTSVCDWWLDLFKSPYPASIGRLGMSSGKSSQSLF
jgi:hypothetical protein